MRRIPGRALLLVAIGVMTVATSAKTSSAAPGDLLNWLFPFRAQRVAYRYGATPTVAYYPNTAQYGTTAYYGGCNTCSNGCATVGCNPCNTGACNQQVVTNYAPQTSYRTAWAQVPVTTYRPVVVTDPCTGCQSTVMSPSTTTAWQVQRIPYTTYRPVQTYMPTTTSCFSPQTYSCSGCGSTTLSACSTCSNCSPTHLQQLPIQETPTPADTPLNPPTNPEPADTAPDLNASGAIDLSPQTSPAVNIVPIPDAGGERNENRAPQLLDPNDRQALRPIRQASYSREIAKPELDTPSDSLNMVRVQVPSPQAEVDESEWDGSGWIIIE